VLVDKKGIIRYSLIGEGAYNKTESVIKRCLPRRIDSKKFVGDDALSEPLGG
jgi:hypothetical protein